MHLRAAANYINNSSYDEAINVLNNITDRDGRWYYYSALAHLGKGEEATALEDSLEKQIQHYEAMFALWNEFDPSLIKVNDVHLGIRKIAGVRVPVLDNVDFDIRPFSLFNSPKWYSDGIHLLKELASTAIEREFTIAKLGLLEHARKKTTQKVNLFEKVQIPGYQDALRKIKRFMEDEENLSKSSQKILKSIQEKRKEAEA